MLEGIITQLSMPEGERNQQLKIKHQEYRQRWLTVMRDPDNFYKAPELVKVENAEWYSWFILSQLIERGQLSTLALQNMMMAETNGGMSTDELIAHLRLISNYLELGHSGEEFGSKPLPPVPKRT